MNGPQAAKQAGVTYRQFDYWTRRGFLHGEREKTGTGFVREYDDEQVRRAWLMGHLTTVGLTPMSAYTVALQLQQRGDGFARLGRVVLLHWASCELCDDFLAPGQVDVHPECLEAEQTDLDGLVWHVSPSKTSRNVENVSDHEGRFS